MKIIGLIGGMSWESTHEYYRIINEQVQAKLGGLHSAKCMIYSFDFDEIEKLQHQGNWAGAAEKLVGAAEKLEKGGADFLVICTNTMHKVAEDIERNTGIPLLHIADATASRIKTNGWSQAGLLGTKFTMEEDFYKSRLSGKHGIDLIIPDAKDRELIHRVIYRELCVGKILDSSKDEFISIINRLAEKGAEAIILGCTEIPLLIKQKDVNLPLLDTTSIHAEYAVEYALNIH